jgi:hypothetical protein
MSTSPEMIAKKALAAEKNIYLIDDIERNTKYTYEVFNDPDDPNEQGKYIGHFVGVTYGGEQGHDTYYIIFELDDNENIWNKPRWFRIKTKD